jgi:hypothetical protein
MQQAAASARCFWRAGEDPVRALRQASQLVKPGGKLVLLEHGSSSYDWLQRKLDDGAEKHFSKWGCRWGSKHAAVRWPSLPGEPGWPGLVATSGAQWGLFTTRLVPFEPVRDA